MTNRGISYEIIHGSPKRYRLTEHHTHSLKKPPGLGYFGGHHGEHSSVYVSLRYQSTLMIYEGFVFDGPSGPALDTTDFMRAALVHDALYGLMREGVLPQSYRKAADQELVRICKQDGMGWFRRQYVYWALRMFGARSARP